MVKAVRPYLLVAGGAIAVASAVGIGRFIFTPILPSMIEGLPLTEGEAGLIASANYLGYLAAALAATSPRMPGSQRAWMLGSLALSALTTGLMFMAGSLATLLAIRFIGGAASAFVFLLTAVIVMQRLTAASRDDLSGMHFIGIGTGISASALVAWAVIAFGGDWRVIWLVGGGVSLAGLIAVAILVPAADQPAYAPDPGVRSARPIGIWPLVTAYALFGFGYVITATFIVAIVRASADLRPIEPFIWLAVGLTAIPSIAFWSGLARRYGILQIFTAACIVEAIGVVLSVASQSPLALFLAAASLGGTFVGITALGLTAAHRIAIGNPRRALALMTAAFGLGQVVGPLAAGYGFDLTGSFFLPSIAAAAALCISAIIAWRLRSHV
ncbi:MAG: YbfB/YjiJ family MFS transporter [Alphaproteobacteria bacterium]